MSDFHPAKYAVYLTLPVDPRRNLKGTTLRIGPAKTLDEARAKIAENRSVCRHTYGGLIEGSSDAGFRYRIFEAVWTEVA